MSLREQNFRDLAGMRVKHGGTVKPGVLYRTSSPSRFSPEERAEFDKFGIKTLLDLRTTREFAMPVNQFDAGSATVLHVPLFEHVRENWKRPEDQSPPATAGRYYEMLGDGMGAVVQVITALSCKVTYPAVVFCGAGRDRTGIVLTCLLDLLGVEEDDIAADYAASDPFFNEGGRAFGPTMLELMKLIRRDHGSTEAMLRGRGLGDNDVGSLRARLVA